MFFPHSPKYRTPPCIGHFTIHWGCPLLRCYTVYPFYCVITYLKKPSTSITDFVNSKSVKYFWTKKRQPHKLWQKMAKSHSCQVFFWKVFLLFYIWIIWFQLTLFHLPLTWKSLNFQKFWPKTFNLVFSFKEYGWKRPEPITFDWLICANSTRIFPLLCKSGATLFKS